VELESKEYSWAWVTADLLLSHGPCELLFAYLVVSAACADSHLYDGESAAGEKIVTLEAAGATGHSFKPKEPVYCRRGLYVDVGTSVTGIFVQWRELK
jgi:hypothetical protein